MSQTAEVDFNEVRKVFAQIAGVKEKIPEIKGRFVERLGPEMLEVVRGNIGGTGKLRSWQEYYIGSLRGYAAVRAVKGETGPNSPGAITNYVENGHRVRDPSGTNPRYRYRGTGHQRVAGKGFYKASKPVISAMAEACAGEIAEAVAKEMTGE